MSKFVPVIALCGLVSLSASAAEKHLSQVFAYQGEALVLDVGVGEVEIVSASDNQFRVDVVVESANSGFLFFSSKKDVSDIELQSELTKGERLALKLTDDDDVKQRWKITLPAEAKVKIDMGVGQITATGLDNSVDIDLGVGEVNVSHSHEYADISLHSGVGEVSYTVNGTEIDVERAMVSQSYQASARGDGALSVDVGVGEVEITKL
ncbi:hypothetical protein KJI95_02160 [Shewanella sp. JM162201]|uniref:Adhesin domain-containing protein n=1 Tax=Shewanella jiangmenensis TaxID=2837387 RepID=A0ABS5V096_9GAMM|nr:hypothetical protein [Shewanella jiangmenensis]MBT1443333.1 hypothetical protein [Shewanella jiangmenensis]